ncbi:sensor histidine kinase [Kitasatospora acidiphila]|uniref:sensor histidine kinase n=1 Tax=Kitasatospora acidiphila TaxID=2567942 RepID=UPI001E3AC3E3|nr:sensor histidine kinase [Kitasatospora acidiphila]
MTTDAPISATEGRLGRFQGWIPYLGLALSAALSLALGPGGTGYRVPVLVLSVIAAGWCWSMEVDQAESERRRVKAVVYYTGLLALMAVLVLLSPFFGFFGFVGYLKVSVLPRRLWWPGITVTAALMAVCQLGGVQNLRGGLIGIYCGLVVVNVVIAGAVTYQAIEEDQRSRQRARYIDELAEANRRLRETMAENAGLHAQLVTQAREAGVLDERQRMAGEIHDTIAQGLTGIVRQLEAAERFDADPERRLHHVATARQLARESLAEARRSVQALRPGPLADAQLPDAVQDLAERWERSSGVAAGVTVTGTAFPLPPALEVVLFRAAQEGLANIAKHARASRVGLTLSYTHEVVLLDVLDDGVGFEPPDETASGQSYGLTAMRQRLLQVGGSLAIESAPGEGTALSISVPALRVPGAGGLLENAP